MIARLRGTPAGRSADGLLLDVNGVGYLVAATPGVMRRAEVGGEISVETFLHVREDALQLYGFVDASERELFTQLLTVSGIGPKVALAVVSGSPAVGAATRDRPRGSRAVPGDPRDRQEDGGAHRAGAEGEGLAPRRRLDRVAAEETPTHLVARDALVELGYSVLEAEQRLAEVDPELPPAERVRLALRAA